MIESCTIVTGELMWGAGYAARVALGVDAGVVS